MTPKAGFLNTLKNEFRYGDGLGYGTHSIFFVDWDVESRAINTEWFESICMWGVGITSLDSRLPEIFLISSVDENNYFLPMFESSEKPNFGAYMTEYWNPTKFPKNIKDLLEEKVSRLPRASSPPKLPEKFYPIIRVELALPLIKGFVKKLTNLSHRYHELTLHQSPPDKDEKGYIDSIETNFSSEAPEAFNHFIEELRVILNK